MKKICFLFPFLLLLGCGGPDPVEEVRKQRSKIKLEVDLTVSAETRSASYVVKAQNLNSTAVLREITVMVEVLDGNNALIWQKQHELNITGLGNYATKDFTYREDLSDEAVAKLEGVDEYGTRIYPAPVDDDGAWKNYNEFRRVVRE